MARKKIREYDSKRLLKQHLKKIAGIDLEIRSAQVTESTDFTELTDKEAWLSSAKLVVEMGGCKAPITTFIVEPFIPHGQEFYLSIVSERLGCTVSFSECGGIEIEENWDKVKTVFLPTDKSLTPEASAPLIATLPLEIRGKIGDFIRAVFATSASLKFTVLNPKGRIWTMVAGGGASVIYADTVGDLGYASELGNYAEYSGAPNEEEVLQYARVVLDCATADPDGRKRALIIGGGIANFTDVATTFNGIIRALREKESKLKASRMHIYVRRGGPNYQIGLAKMRALGEELGVPLEVYGPEATMTGICKRAIDCVMSAA
ncbi:ATP-citrate synthase alpha chain protein 3 [Nymphaea thermarum]|nr:ATP-citrate synthase alpha chain protein 3 [Nymphaea thermarum]